MVQEQVVFAITEEWIKAHFLELSHVLGEMGYAILSSEEVKQLVSRIDAILNNGKREE
jgi:hypothetical protein